MILESLIEFHKMLFTKPSEVLNRCERGWSLMNRNERVNTAIKTAVVSLAAFGLFGYTVNPAVGFVIAAAVGIDAFCYQTHQYGVLDAMVHGMCDALNGI